MLRFVYRNLRVVSILSLLFLVLFYEFTLRPLGDVETQHPRNDVVQFHHLQEQQEQQIQQKQQPEIQLDSSTSSTPSLKKEDFEILDQLDLEDAKDENEEVVEEENEVEEDQDEDEEGEERVKEGIEGGNVDLNIRDDEGEELNETEIRKAELDEEELAAVDDKTIEKVILPNHIDEESGLKILENKYGKFDWTREEMPKIVAGWKAVYDRKIDHLFDIFKEVCQVVNFH